MNTWVCQSFCCLALPRGLLGVCFGLEDRLIFLRDRLRKSLTLRVGLQPGAEEASWSDPRPGSTNRDVWAWFNPEPKRSKLQTQVFRVDLLDAEGLAVSAASFRSNEGKRWPKDGSFWEVSFFLVHKTYKQILHPSLLGKLDLFWII